MAQPVDISSILFHPIPPPKPSAKPFKLSVIPAGHLSFPGHLFVQGYEGDLDLEDYSFLLERNEGEKFIWDLGLRQGLKYDASSKHAAEAFHGQAPTSVSDALKSHGISPESIVSIFFSHTHFDHVGDIKTFPTSTSIVLGPRQKEPSVEELATELQVSQEDLRERSVRFCSEEKDEWFDIGSFKGIDYFKDSTLFILSTPGHHAGSISLLVLTSLEPIPTYHLLAGDAAHHISLLRGAANGVYKAKENPMRDQPGEDGEKEETFELDVAQSARTQAALGRMDQEPNLVVWLAHDASMQTALKIPVGEVHPLKGDLEELAMLKKRTEEDYRGKPVIFGLGGRRVEIERNHEKVEKEAGSTSSDGIP